MPRTTELALLAMALLSGACSDAGVEKITRQYQSAIDRNVAALTSVGEQIRRMPPIQKDSVAWSGPLLVAHKARHSTPATADIAYFEDLATPTELGYVWGRIRETGNLNHCAALLALGHEAYDPTFATRALGARSQKMLLTRYPTCAALTVLFVVRTLEFTQPTAPLSPALAFVPFVEPTDAGAEAGPALDAGAEAGPLLAIGADSQGRAIHRTTFDGGAIRGDVLAFELPTAKFLGGFRFAVKSSAQVSGSDFLVDADLQNQMSSAVIDGIRAAVPTATMEE
jgi:hypothetical protein